MATIANDLEDAIMYTCLSNDIEKGAAEVELIGGNDHYYYGEGTDDDSSCLPSPKPKTRIALSPDGSFASMEDSTCDNHSDSDSDVSLCRSSRPHRRRRPSATLETTTAEQQQDSDCTTFFLGDACNLHLEGATCEGTLRDRNATTPPRIHPLHANAPISSRQSSPMFKKSSLKQSSFSQQTSRNDNNNHKDNHKSVQFAHVNVREYCVSLSQNPSCSEGPPIELGWDFEEPPPVCLEEYEEERLPQRRKLHDLLLSDRVRRNMLEGVYTAQQIKLAIREVEQLKRQRILTYMLLPAAALDEAAEEWYDYWAQVFR